MRLGTRKLSVAGLVVIIGTLAMLLSACGTTSSGSGQQASKDKQIFKPLSGGANAGDLDTLDPGQIQFGFDYDKAQMIYPALITLTDDLKPIDWAAKSHEISSDGLTYTFHLNSGMKWSDGTAIDANTFAYSINRSLDPCFASGVSYYNLNIKGATDYNSKTCDAGTDGLDKTAEDGADRQVDRRLRSADPQGHDRGAGGLLPQRDELPDVLGRAEAADRQVWPDQVDSTTSPTARALVATSTS